MTEDTHWTVWMFTIIGTILFIFLVAVGDRGQEFDLENSYENNPSPEVIVDSTYPLGVER